MQVRGRAGVRLKQSRFYYYWPFFCFMTSTSFPGLKTALRFFSGDLIWDLSHPRHSFPKGFPFSVFLVSFCYGRNKTDLWQRHCSVCDRNTPRRSKNTPHPPPASLIRFRTVDGVPAQLLQKQDVMYASTYP